MSRAGNLLLYAVKDATGELRAYRVDRIESVEVTTKPFTPTRRVEFRPTGTLSAPPIGGRFDTPQPRSRASARAQYCVECPMCGKIFRRSRPGSRLNPHKDPGGFPCSGRMGHQIL